MFDFANQAYTLLIITVIFGDLFTRIIVGASQSDPTDFRMGNLLWSVALSVSYLMVVITAPIAGAVMDQRHARKRFLLVSYVMCVVSTALLYFGQPGWVVLTMILIVISNYAYAMGESFIASFLPSLGPPEDLGWISGIGWGLGYVGGLVATIFALAFLGEVSLENFEKIRWVGPFASIFFLIAALPTFVYLRERTSTDLASHGPSPLALAADRLRNTYQNLGMLSDLKRLLVSIFFMTAGLYIVISFAFIYGAQVIGWDEPVRVLMFVTVQISATVGAFFFGWAHGLYGAKQTYVVTLILWVIAIASIWKTPQLTLLLNEWLELRWQAQYVFLGAGLLAGLSLGASQSAGRALVGMLTPETKAAEFFGLWSMVSKAAAIFGLLGLGFLQSKVGLENAIAFCLALMVLALIGVSRVNLNRGQQFANDWRDTQ